jgi:hypothetical protein
MMQFEDNRNRAYNEAQFGAMMAGGQEQSRLFDLSMQSRQQSIGEQDAIRDRPFQEMSQILAAGEGYGNMANQYQIAQDNIARDYGIQAKDQSWKTGESALDRDQQRFLQKDQQTFTGDQNRLDRDAEAGLQTADLSFRGDEGRLDRDAQAGLQVGDQGFRGSDREDTQQWQGKQNRKDRRIERRGQNIQKELAYANIASQERMQGKALAAAGRGGGGGGGSSSGYDTEDVPDSGGSGSGLTPDTTFGRSASLKKQNASRNLRYVRR